MSTSTSTSAPHVPGAATVDDASASASHPPPPAAPWSQLFQAHIAAQPSPEFVLSTLQPVPASSSQKGQKDPTPTYLPRARYCIYRGMWAHLPANERNAAPRNPPRFASDCPTFTTDARMEKVPQLFGSGGGGGSGNGSGGGGPVEAVWWVKEKMAQWRVKGRAWVVGPDADGEEEGARVVREEVGRWMRGRTAEEMEEEEGKEEKGKEGGGAEGKEEKEGGKAEDWSWSKEVTAHFGNCSPGMRGTFKNPPPGTPVPKKSSLTSPSNETNNETNNNDNDNNENENPLLGQKVTDLHDPAARHNFRVVVIVPQEVEYTDLREPERARRFRFRYRYRYGGVGVEGEGREGEEGGEKGGKEGRKEAVEWIEEELWP